MRKALYESDPVPLFCYPSQSSNTFDQSCSYYGHVLSSSEHMEAGIFRRIWHDLWHQGLRVYSEVHALLRQSYPVVQPSQTEVIGGPTLDMIVSPSNLTALPKILAITPCSFHPHGSFCQWRLKSSICMCFYLTCSFLFEENHLNLSLQDWEINDLTSTFSLSYKCTLHITEHNFLAFLVPWEN